MGSRRAYGFALALVALAVVLSAAGVADDPAKLTNWQALVLGAVQGLTELLPISSSGHLILVPWLAGWTYLAENRAFNQTFDVALHLGTLLAVGAYFWRDVVAIVAAWARSLQSRTISTPEAKVAWIVLVATIPAGLLGYALEDPIASRLGHPWQIAILLGLFAVVLWLVDRRPARRQAHELGLGEGLGIGLAQALALMPGVSRSGITISAGRLLGLDRDAAARLSFLLLIPVVLGAVALKGLKDVVFGTLPSGWVGPFVVGTLAAAGAGLLAIEWLLGYVRRHDYSLFVLYRLLATAAILLLIATGVRSATF